MYRDESWLPSAMYSKNTEGDIENIFFDASDRGLKAEITDEKMAWYEFLFCRN